MYEKVLIKAGEISATEFAPHGDNLIVSFFLLQFFFGSLDWWSSEFRVLSRVHMTAIQFFDVFFIRNKEFESGFT